MTMKNIRKCPVCKQASLVVKQKPSDNGFYVTCLGYPACRNTYWLPPTVIDAKVSDSVCSQVINYTLR